MAFEIMKNPELHGWCKNSGAQSLNGRKKFIAALPEVFRRHMYKEYSCGSIYEYAAKLCGVSRQMVDDVIRVDEKLKDMPELRGLIGEVGLSKVKTVASVATKETDHEWAKKVTNMTRGAVETDVRDLKNLIPGETIYTAPEKSSLDNQVEFEHFSATLDPEIILKLKIIKSKMRKGATWNEVFERLVDVPRPKLQKNSKPSNLKSRQASTKQRREALEKTHGKCSIEGCNKPATEIHHPKPWAINKSHDELEPLCKNHHELAHQSKSTIDQKFRQYKLQVAMF